MYRQRSYEAETLEEACRLAVIDDDWSEQKEDYESSGETYVTGAWPGEDTAYRIAALPLPSQFGEMLQRKADHYETLLGILKFLAPAPEAPFWRERADAAIAKAEAILAGAPLCRNRGKRAMSEYIVKIGFWLRAYDSFAVEAESDADAIENAKAAAKTAMASGAYPEHIDVEERREGIIAFIDHITPDGRQAVIEAVKFDDDHIHDVPRA